MTCFESQDKMQIKDNRQTTTQDYLNSISGRYVGRVVGTLASWVEAQGHLIKVWYTGISVFDFDFEIL